VPREGMFRLQEHRVDRDARGRVGEPQGPPDRGIRPGTGLGLRVRDRRRTGGHVQIRHQRYPSLLRERPAVPETVLI